MTTATASPNGRLPRKQLGDQLDRLDSILDGLADALNEAVADAARDGARAAVKEILTELLTNPQFAGLLRQPAAKAETPANAARITKPSVFARLRGAVKHVSDGVVGAVKTAAAKARSVAYKSVTQIKTAAGPVSAVVDVLRLTGGLKKAIWIGSAVGLTAGAACAVCPHWVATAVSTGAAAVSAVAVQAGFAFKSLFARFRVV